MYLFYFQLLTFSVRIVPQTVDALASPPAVDYYFLLGSCFLVVMGCFLRFYFGLSRRHVLCCQVLIVLFSVILLQLQGSVILSQGSWIAQNNRNLFSHSSGHQRLETKVLAGLFFWRLWWGSCSVFLLASGHSQKSLAFFSSQMNRSSLYTHLHMFFYLCFCSLLTGIPVIGFSIYLNPVSTYLKLIISAKILFPNKVTFASTRT